MDQQSNFISAVGTPRRIEARSRAAAFAWGCKGVASGAAVYDSGYPASFSTVGVAGTTIDPGAWGPAAQ